MLDKGKLADEWNLNCKEPIQEQNKKMSKFILICNSMITEEAYSKYESMPSCILQIILVYPGLPDL